MTRFTLMASALGAALMASSAALAQVAPNPNNPNDTVADTFTPPPLFFGFANGADFVVHSMTKYLNGHADALAGVVIGKGDEAHTLIPLVRTLGPNLAANEAYMVLRGLKTLTLRLRRQMLNARLIARALAQDPRITRVVYPGVPSHPQYETARRLFRP